VIRWEQQENGDWHGFSGELPVPTVAKDPDAEREQWAWKIRGLKRPKGWRKPIGTARHGSMPGAPQMRTGRSGLLPPHSGRISSGSRWRVFRLRSAPKQGAAHAPRPRRRGDRMTDCGCDPQPVAPLGVR
jgi:hypothetical protein